MDCICLAIYKDGVYFCLCNCFILFYAFAEDSFGLAGGFIFKLFLHRQSQKAWGLGVSSPPTVTGKWLPSQLQGKAREPRVDCYLICIWQLRMYSGRCLLCDHAQSLSHLQLLTTPWTVARQAPHVHGLFRQDWNGLLFSSSRGFSQPRDWTSSLTSPALTGIFFTTSATWAVHYIS